MSCLRSLAVLLLVLSTGCGPSGGSTSEVRYPGELVSTDEISGSFLARQRVIAAHPEGESRFEAVLQSRPGELTLIGLTPFGTRAFVLQQRGTTVTFDVEAAQVLQQMPFSPRYVLLDIHRTFFIEIPGAPLSDGAHRYERFDEMIVEHWKSGRLRQRTFSRKSGPPKGEIAIAFAGGKAPGEIPDSIVLQNGWFGYRLTIETLSVQRL